MMPAEWMYFKARKIWYTKNWIWSSLSRWIFKMFDKSAPIRMETKYLKILEKKIPTYTSFKRWGSRSGVKTSYMSITFSWFIKRRSLNSRWVRFAWIGLWNGRVNFLIATLSPVVMHSAALKIAVDRKIFPTPTRQFRKRLFQLESNFGNTVEWSKPSCSTRPCNIQASKSDPAHHTHSSWIDEKSKKL